MKKIFSFLLTAVLFALPALAIAGSPWGNVAYRIGNSTFQGTIKGSGISGITVFSTSGDGTTIPQLTQSGSNGVPGFVNSGVSQVLYTTGTNGISYPSAIATIPPNTTMLQGYGLFYVNGTMTVANIAVATNSGGSISGIIDCLGQSHAQTISTGDIGGAKAVYNPVYYAGDFSANFPKFSNANYIGKGSLTMEFIPLADILTASNGAGTPVPKIQTKIVSFKMSGIRTASRSNAYSIVPPVTSNSGFPHAQ